MQARLLGNKSEQQLPTYHNIEQQAAIDAYRATIAQATEPPPAKPARSGIKTGSKRPMLQIVARRKVG